MMKMDDVITEWEGGLPSPEELTPLSQSLISPELASAFSISCNPSRTIADVHRASQSTFAFPPFIKAEEEHSPLEAPADGVQAVGSSRPVAIPAAVAADQNVHSHPQGFQAQGIPAVAFSPPPPPGHLGSSPGYGHDGKGGVPALANGISPYTASSYDRRLESSPGAAASPAGADSRDGSARKLRKPNDGENEDADSGPVPENSNEEQPARTLKRPRLVWTPQLHKRFVDAVTGLGIKNAVPKTIMQIMNVEGLTRENVASHLQKYRLYLKRVTQGHSNEAPSSSDHLFASTPLPPSIAASAHFLAAHRDDVMPVPFGAPVVPVSLAGLSHGHLHGHMNAAGPFAGFDPHAYSALARTPPQRLVSGDQRELVGENHSQQPGSPPRHILTLFPTSSR